MLKPIVSRFRSNLSVCLGDIAEKQVPAKLKPLVTIIRGRESRADDRMKVMILQEKSVTSGENRRSKSGRACDHGEQTTEK